MERMNRKPEKWLVPDPDDLYVPNGPGYPGPAPVSAPDGWRDIRPELFLRGPPGRVLG